MVRWAIQPGPLKTFKRFLIYSRNNIQAGLWRRWQAPIFKRYGIIVLSALPLAYFGFKWLVVPFVLWLGFMWARAVKAIWLNRHSYPAGLMRNSARITLVMPILATLDLATIAGTVWWLISVRSNSNPHESRR
jgi:hypothetical protein